MKKAYFSNRIYKSGLHPKYVEAIGYTLFLWNRAKHFAFQTQVLEKRSGTSKRSQSVHMTIKSRFSLNDYYANSAVQEANALLSSQTELQKLYIENKKEQIHAVKKKIKQTKSNLTVLRKIKQSFIKGKPKFNKTSKEQQMGRYFVVQFKKRTDLYYHAYQFEHTYIDPEIKHLQSKLRKLRFRFDRLQKQLDSLTNKVSSAVFGSKKLCKAQHTVEKYKEDHQLWKHDFTQARYQNMLISGRKDAKSGNFVFTYNPDTQSLRFITPNGITIEIPHLTFPYGQDQVNHAVQTQWDCTNKKKAGKPIGWAIEDHGAYYIFKCVIDGDENSNQNFSRSDGVIGVDCNVDHFAWANINKKGQLIKIGTFSFGLEGKTSGQITKIIEAETVALVDLAVKTKKPLVVEKLKLTKAKVKNPYGNKKANRIISMFAYRKMISAIQSRAKKMGVTVFEVNPAYTSQMGKMKYMKRFGISIHQAASYVIARRAMGFEEKLPPVLYSLLPEKMVGLHHWAQWKYWSRILSDLRVHAFYQMELSSNDKIRSINELFPPGALTDWEIKGLSQFESRRIIFC
ncbi:IS200/IS605 family accessory protein TnpB-related protein [Bacillus sp. JJ1127]|uniref:IS200/IS605 family accessory protein TnpB-related protein n=1 Tax=Bacillus sp. JJ1127 TaxID=3122952 RepID=UPI002FFE3FA6